MSEMSMNKAIHGAFRRDLDWFLAALTVKGTELKQHGQVVADGPSLGYPPVKPADMQMRRPASLFLPVCRSRGMGRRAR